MYVRVSCSSEADGCADDVTVMRSAVSLPVRSTAAKVSLQEHEVFRRHHTTRWVHPQRRKQLCGKSKRYVVMRRGRCVFAKVWKQGDVCAGYLVTLAVRNAYTVYLYSVHQHFRSIKKIDVRKLTISFND